MPGRIDTRSSFITPTEVTHAKIHSQRCMELYDEVAEREDEEDPEKNYHLAPLLIIERIAFAPSLTEKIQAIHTKVTRCNNDG